MNKQYTFQDAKGIIQEICEAADAGKFKTRADFMNMLEKKPHVAVQGYNPYGKIFFWNEASSHLYGYRESEAINSDLFEILIPAELRQFARDAVRMAQKTGKMPDPTPCDLHNNKGEYITVYSGHLVFQWDFGTMPEFYCIDLALDVAQEELKA